MASYYFQFLAVFIIFLAGIQKGFLAPSPASHNNENFFQAMSSLLNRLDQLEAKVGQHEVKINSQQAEMNQLNKKNNQLEAKVDQHEVKVNSQQIKIDQMKKKNDQLEAKVEQHEVKINSQQTEMNQLKKKNNGQLEAKVEQHDVKINSQETEINRLKKKNSELLEETNQQLLNLAGFLPRSCFELKAANPSTKSGVYSIDPDGQIGGDPPIKVYCDMATRTTSIYHDTEEKTNITACLDPGCYAKAITYNATMRQLAMLADISISCKQHIRFDSTGVPIEYKNAQYGFWNDRNGGKQIFWAGPATSEHTCQCGIMNNCVERSYKCNGDSLAPIDLVDEGFITATELLPVTRLNFGRTSLTGAKASYTLGRFECTGQAAISSKPTNCQDLFKMGHTLSGFYDVKGGSNQIASTYCDFSKSSTDPGYETRYGFVDVKSSPVHFFVTRIFSWNATGTMPFEMEYLNLGGGMNLASGVFTAPKSGIYAFSFKGLASESGSDYDGHAFVRLQRNGADVATGYSYVDSAVSGIRATVSVHGTLKLNKGDTIAIRHVDGTIYSSSNNQHIQFTGSLLEEDLVIS